jgi:MFS family permease
MCGTSLTAHWAFMFWYLQHLRNHPDLASWTDAERTRIAGIAMWVVMLTSIIGNFLAAAFARFLGYRKAIAIFCVAYFVSIALAYGWHRDHDMLWYGFIACGISQGVFGLFTMYLPPLFPTLLRTTGAGFCYNIGRIAAGLGTVFAGMLSGAGDQRLAIFYAGFLFLPAALIAQFLIEPPDELPVVPEDLAKGPLE